MLGYLFFFFLLLLKELGKVRRGGGGGMVLASTPRQQQGAHPICLPSRVRKWARGQSINPGRFLVRYNQELKERPSWET